jgi:pimeloyl-ACP methyl ester carboxylesterase
MKASLLFALVLAASAPVFAADQATQSNPYSMSIAPAERFEVGSLQVERHGSGGRPLILIPGLASGAWVWQDTVRDLAGSHALYVVTLPGFDGRPTQPGNMMDAARKAINELIVSRKLDKPVLVGHSLGGTLAFAVAEDHPELIGGVVAIDGLPVMPGTENMPAEARAQLAAQTKARVLQAPRDGFPRQQRSYMQTIGVLDTNRAEKLAELTSRSDPAAVAQAMEDDLALDLRPGLSRITAPVLLVSPWFEADGSQMGLTEPVRTDYYKSLVAGAPKAEVVSISPSRHFVMFDQPKQLADAIRTFLSKL